MTVTINFVDSRVRKIEAKDVTIHKNDAGVLCVSIKTDKNVITYYASTIASINYDVQKPHINVSSVFVW